MTDNDRMAKRSRLSDEVREAIESSPKSRYQICKEMGGFSESVMSRFMSGQSGFSMATLDELAEVLDLHITPPHTGKRARGR